MVASDLRNKMNFLAVRCGLPGEVIARYLIEELRKEGRVIRVE